MVKNWNNYINRKFGAHILSKWVVLCFDIIITIFTYGIAYVLRYNFKTEIISFEAYMHDTILTAIAFIISFLIFKPYDGIIRHSGIADALRLVKSGITAALLIITFSLICKFNNFNFGVLPLSIAIIHTVMVISVLLFSRYGIKVFFYQVSKNKITPIPVVIYGAGRRGLSVLQAITTNTNNNYEIVAFIDDNESKIGKTIEGIKIYSPDKFIALIEKYGVKELIIGIQSLNINKKNAIVDISLQNQVSVKSVPGVNFWINGQLNLQQIKNIKIEDLLGREQIKLHNPLIEEIIIGKTILVTGAAGSIGSELVRQILAFKPAQLILVDQAESPLFDLKMELQYQSQVPASIQVEYIICDIVHETRLANIFSTYKPEVVFHAAAYKHVPLMETNVQEAVQTNILGTKNLVDLAILNNVKKFILISTDKAVNPTNVMGATKRAAEIYVQYQSKRGDVTTHFITTRFGNVLGSNGSVVNYFKKQIETGGPLTITHPEVTRYFMTIAEACQLVLEAVTIGKTSEIYIFDMGEPIKIVDLAGKMVLLSGLIPEVDIKFVYTGLRPGEKLHEELLNAGENTLPTHNHKIKIALTGQHQSEVVCKFIQNLALSLETQDPTATVVTLKEMIPEFISRNSTFEQLDKQAN